MQLRRMSPTFSERETVKGGEERKGEGQREIEIAGRYVICTNC